MLSIDCIANQTAMGEGSLFVFGRKSDEFWGITPFPGQSAATNCLNVKVIQSIQSE